MRVTEMLVTGFDGACVVFAVNLAPDGAKVIRPGTSIDGEPVVGEAWEKATNAFNTVRELMEGIVEAEAEASF